MKIICAFLIFLINSNILDDQEIKSQSEQFAVIEWQKTSIDFGKVPIGKPVTAVFVFKNKGMVPLVLKDVKSSCGCTVADYPKQPVLPGGQGEIKATYDAKLSGYFNKTISVYSNTEDAVTELYIKGEVIK